MKSKRTVDVDILHPSQRSSSDRDASLIIFSDPSSDLRSLPHFPVSTFTNETQYSHPITRQCGFDPDVHSTFAPNLSLSQRLTRRDNTAGCPLSRMVLYMVNEIIWIIFLFNYSIPMFMIERIDFLQSIFYVELIIDILISMHLFFIFGRVPPLIVHIVSH